MPIRQRCLVFLLLVMRRSAWLSLANPGCASGAENPWHASEFLLDMGEETGSTGLSEVCADLADDLAADLLIASDGCRLSAQRRSR
ncbi:hypothetical protein AB0H34_11525 [Saccharopolyspora shandongensis]|uniref:hypothetical protein n=1 Tax=Saccharopolyspora shandongensis TaxID=418495 RepID=UPI003408A29C